MAGQPRPHRLPRGDRRHAGPGRRHPRRHRARTGLAGRASAALHRRHLGPSRAAHRPHPFPDPPGRPRRTVDLPWPRPARGLCAARPQPAPRQRAAARRALLRARPGGVADPRPRPLRHQRRAPDRPRRHMGRPAAARRKKSPPSACGFALGELAWHRAERRAGPRALRRHRALRHQRVWRDQPARARRSATMADADTALRAAWDEVFSAAAEAVPAAECVPDR